MTEELKIFVLVLAISPLSILIFRKIYSMIFSSIIIRFWYSLSFYVASKVYIANPDAPRESMILEITQYLRHNRIPYHTESIADQVGDLVSKKVEPEDPYLGGLYEVLLVSYIKKILSKFTNVISFLVAFILALLVSYIIVRVGG